MVACRKQSQLEPVHKALMGVVRVQPSAKFRVLIRVVLSDRHRIHGSQKSNCGAKYLRETPNR